MADNFRRIMAAAYDERMQNEPTPFLSSMFGAQPGSLILSETDRVEVDIIRDDARVAVDVVRGAAQHNVNDAGQFSNKEFKVPLYDERAPITASMLSKRIPGMDPYAPGDPAMALAYHASTIQRGQARKIIREIERMAAEALQSGTITLKNSDSLDFKRKSTHSDTPTTKWGNSGHPLADIEAMCSVIKKDGKRKPKRAIFGNKAWNVFFGNADVLAVLDKKWVDANRISPSEVAQGGTYKGRMWFGDYELDLYTYPEYYINAAGVETPYIVEDTVILMDPTARLDKAFGAIELMPGATEDYRRRGLPVLPEFVQGQIVPYVKEDYPTALWAGVQSAPLVIPTAIDTIGVLINVD
jgi:hypothetical protein